jgi:hypothetical protein
VVLIEERRMAGKVIHEERLNIAVPGIFIDEMMTEENASCIGIHHKNRFFTRI